MTESLMSYAVITPAKNEERFLGETIESMIAQKHKPVAWIVVDDASTDGTARIVKEYTERYPWIRHLLHPGEAVRKTGSAEIHAFNYGLKALGSLAFDLIVKLDADLRFDAGYFKALVARFAQDPHLGIASGIYLEEDAQDWKPVIMPPYHAAGASKVVRRECFDQIGGFIAQRGWDTVDEIRARAKGWETRHFPDMRFYHLRKEGTGMGNLHTSVMHGEIFHRTGGGFLFFIIKALNRIVRGNPTVVSGAAMIYGYLSSLMHRRKMLVSVVEARMYRHMLSRRLHSGLRHLMPGRS